MKMFCSFSSPCFPKTYKLFSIFLDNVMILISRHFVLLELSCLCFRTFHLVIFMLSLQIKSCYLPLLPRRKELLSELRPIHARLSREDSVAQRRPIYRCSELQVSVIIQLLLMSCLAWYYDSYFELMELDQPASYLVLSSIFSCTFMSLSMN